MEIDLKLKHTFVSDNSTLVQTGGLIAKNILDLRLYEFFFISIYLTFFIFIIKFIVKNQKLDKNKVYFLISYHYFFVILAYVYSLLNVNDLDSFFQTAYLFLDSDDNHMANNNMVLINRYLIHIFNLHYFSIFIFFGFFSSIGFLLLFISINEILKEFNLNTNLLFGLFLFPSWHFFTSFPGKDSIYLFSIGLFFFYFIKKNVFYLIISIILIYLVRPHILMLVLFSGLLIWVHYYLKNTIKSKLSYFILILIIIASSLMALKQINPNTFSHIANFFEHGALYRSYSNEFAGWYETGNNIFINSFKYLLYPLFDFSNLNRAIVSLENILIILLVLKTLLNFDEKTFNLVINKKVIIFSVLFFISMLVVLSNFTANIGISARQKWMMMPFLFLFIIPFLGKLKSSKL